MLTRLLQSKRCLERAAQRILEFGRLASDFKTIVDFRRDNAGAHEFKRSSATAGSPACRRHARRYGAGGAAWSSHSAPFLPPPGRRSAGCAGSRPAQELAQLPRRFSLDRARLGYRHGVIPESGHGQRLQQLATIGVRIAAHAAMARRRQRGQVGREATVLVEQLYARRKGWSLQTAERWLAPNLGYEPKILAEVTVGAERVAWVGVMQERQELKERKELST